MDRIYSKRNSPQPDTYRYDMPDHVRWRILHTFDQVSERPAHQFLVPRMLAEVEKKLLQQYGGLYQPSYRAASQSDDPVIDHFLCSSDEMALDFIELCFQTTAYRAGNRGVEAINRVLEEEAIGYELTPWRETETGEVGYSIGPLTGGKVIRVEHPRFVKKDDQYIHREIVRPCLDVLGDPNFETAHSEMLEAHESYRKGNYPDAITACGSAFESVLKTICDRRGWPYDADKDTAAALVRICKDNGLFPPFYAPIFEATGTIRNKLGDAHGRGPAAMYAVQKEHVDHMIQMTSSHIILLVQLAKL